MKTTSPSVIAVGLIVAATLAACAPTRGAAYEKAIAEAKRAVHAGHFDEAAGRFDEAARTAKVPRDGVFARFEAATARTRTDDVARGIAELRALAQAEPPNAYSAQASYKLAELTLASDEEAGYRALEELVVRYPQDGVGRIALGRILRHDDAVGGPAKTLEHLERLAPKIAPADPKRPGLEEVFAYERAKRLAELGRTEDARKAMLDVADRWPYPYGGYFDDALFRASELDQKLGKTQDAIAHLERLLAVRETSTVLGTYERPKYVPAILRLADIYENELHDRARARDTLRRFYRDFPSSLLRDDMLWREAELWRKDGDQASACNRLATLASDFPDSRYVPCASLRCPEIKRPDKSKAPKECRDYIVRGEASVAGTAPPATGEGLP